MFVKIIWYPYSIVSIHGNKLLLRHNYLPRHDCPSGSVLYCQSSWLSCKYPASRGISEISVSSLPASRRSTFQFSISDSRLATTAPESQWKFDVKLGWNLHDTTLINMIYMWNVKFCRKWKNILLTFYKWKIWTIYLLQQTQIYKISNKIKLNYQTEYYSTI